MATHDFTVNDLVIVKENDVSAKIGKGKVVATNYRHDIDDEDGKYIRVQYPDGGVCFVRPQHVTKVRVLPAKPKKKAPPNTISGFSGGYISSSGF